VSGQRAFARLSFHGAARGVTGSCFLLEFRGRKILIDCGMFQGSRELEEENAEPFGFKPAQIDTLLLTHGHLDHCGRIPLLVKRGFRGDIVTTPAAASARRRATAGVPSNPCTPSRTPSGPWISSPGR